MLGAAIALAALIAAVTLLGGHTDRVGDGLYVLYLAPAEAPPRALWIMPLAGDEPRRIFAPPFGVLDFAPAPDGRWVAAAANRADGAADLWLVRVDGSGARRITDCAPDSCAAPTWSPDGQQVAYERRDSASGEGRIWVYDRRMASSVPLFADESVTGLAPLWSPNGGRLAFYDVQAGVIRAIDLTTGDSTFIPDQMGEVGSFAPDGASMVYADIRPVGRQFFPQLWRADLETGSVHPLLDEAEDDRMPAWSPDGRWLAFARRRLDEAQGAGSQLMLLDLRTGELRQVTDDAEVNHTRFRWHPQGRYLLVQRFKLTESAAEAEIWVYDLTAGEFALAVEGGMNAEWLP